MSKVIRDCIGFALLRSVIGLENSRHPLNQSNTKLKPFATWSLAFSRASGRLHVFTLSSHWLLVIFTFVLIGRCDYFRFGFKTLNRKALYFKITYGVFISLCKSSVPKHRLPYSFLVRREVALVIIQHNDWKQAMRNRTKDGTTINTPMRKLIKKLPGKQAMLFNLTL